MIDLNHKFDKDGKLKYRIIKDDKNRNIIFVENLVMFLSVFSVLACVLYLLIK